MSAVGGKGLPAVMLRCRPPAPLHPQIIRMAQERLQLRRTLSDSLNCCTCSWLPAKGTEHFRPYPTWPPNYFRVRVLERKGKGSVGRSGAPFPQIPAEPRLEGAGPGKAPTHLARSAGALRAGKTLRWGIRVCETRAKAYSNRPSWAFVPPPTQLPASSLSLRFRPPAFPPTFPSLPLRG